MKFSDLSEKSKTIAAQDYLDGWMETHVDTDLTLRDCFEILYDSDDYDFYKSGKLKTDEKL